MFRHRGSARTLKHNLKIASILSFVAGMVNVAGFLSIQRLTTNITGHFAFLIDEVFKLNFFNGFTFFLYILFFFMGSFFSNFFVEFLHRKNSDKEYIIPVVFESILLLIAALLGQLLIKHHPNALAMLLLFAMGMQNSLVTTISNSAVRTTHLTGLFTDLGIELSQLFFYTHQEQRKKLFSSIKLRLTIISFFFIGGLTGGILYSSLHLHVLALASFILFSGIFYNYLKYRIITMKRKHHYQK